MPTSTSEITATERQMLKFERENTWWAYAGHHESAVLAEFGLSMTAYNRRLLVLLRKPEAEVFDPITVRRLRGRVDARRGRRVA